MRFKNLKHKNKHSNLINANTDDPELQDNMYRCQVCGHPCDPDIVSVRKGIKQPETWADGNITHPEDSDGDVYPDIETGNGCPKCGSTNSR